MKSHPLGFTLVELLVVISIISLLLATLTPTFVTAIGMAREATCLNNMNLLSKAVASYTEANHEYLPINDYKPQTYYNVDANDMLEGQNSTMRWWCNKVYSYSVRKPKAFICPSDPGRAGPDEPVKCGYGFNNTLTNPSSGGMDGDPAAAAGDGVAGIFEIKKPEWTAIIGHCSDLTRQPAIVEQMAWPTAEWWPRGHMPRYDHTAKARLGRAGFVMANGSVKTKTYTDAVKLKTTKDQLLLFHKGP